VDKRTDTTNALDEAKAALERCENKHAELTARLQTAKEDAAAARAKAHELAFAVEGAFAHCVPCAS